MNNYNVIFTASHATISTMNKEEQRGIFTLANELGTHHCKKNIRHFDTCLFLGMVMVKYRVHETTWFAKLSLFNSIPPNPEKAMPVGIVLTGEVEKTAPN